MDFLDCIKLSHIPKPSQKRIALRVKPAAEREIRRGHPWLFDQAITYQSQEGNPGDLAVIFDSKRKFLAIGLYDPTSVIRVRVLQHRQTEKIDQSWFSSRLQAAVKIRSSLPPSTTGYRVLHGENDGFPGMVIDRYHYTFVVKIYTASWLPHLKLVLSELGTLFPIENIVLRLGREVQLQGKWLYGLGEGDILYGDEILSPVTFLENGIRFEVDVIHGQKTGFFLDQRENRNRVEKLSKGKSVLNVFSYTGGFSIYAARGGATEVTSVDISQPALQTTARNFEHNQNDPNISKARHQTILGDAFQVLERMIHHGQKFDMVIIDPPSFAKNQKEVGRGLQNYQRLTQLGVQTLRASGIFIQASCSSRITADQFFQAIHQAAIAINRPLTEIERTFHASDHPIGFTEGAYLKCLFAKLPTEL